MTNLNKTFFIDGKAEAVRERINFSKFSVHPESLTVDEINSLLELPDMDTGCLVRTNPNKSGSAFGQMVEHAILAGFMRTDAGIKALVVWTERPDSNGSFDFSFVKLSHFKLPKSKKKVVAKDAKSVNMKKLSSKKIAMFEIN